MSENKPKILILSSANPAKGPGVMAADYYEALKAQGYEADVLTLNKCDEHPEFLYVRDSGSIIERGRNKTKNVFSKVVGSVRAKFHNCLATPHPGHHFFYYEEEKPPVSVNKILSKIQKQYDIVYIFFWQGMLSFATVREIYRKLHCVVFFAGVDYSHMSGGCHFTGECDHYKTACGCCPAFESKDPNDFTRHNILYRQKVYDEVRPIVCGNSYMFEFYKKSYLLGDYSRLVFSYPIINENIFSPLDKHELRVKYQVDNNVSFVIFFGCQNLNDKRKGMSYLLEALEKAYNRISIEEKDKILLLIAGRDVDSIRDKLLFKYKYVGYVPQNQLPEMYSLSDVYVCSSVNDAGPMMVNQSLMCGTPVVGFEMGACLDVVKGRGTGYVARLGDSNDLCNGILAMFEYHKNTQLYGEIRQNCRTTAMQTSSYSAMVNSCYSAYKKYKSKEYE